MIKSCKRAFAALALIVFASPAWPQVVAEEAPILRLECGGIGLEESERMRAEIGMHALTVFFSTTAGGWVTDVETQVDEPLSGQRVEASCGPIGQVDVPTPGRYRISASYAGERQEHWVDLAPQGGARLSLRWQE